MLQENTIIKLPRFRPEKPSLAFSFHRWKNYGSRKLPRLHNDLARKPASIFSELEGGGGREWYGNHSCGSFGYDRGRQQTPSLKLSSAKTQPSDMELHPWNGFIYETDIMMSCSQAFRGLNGIIHVKHLACDMFPKHEFLPFSFSLKVSQMLSKRGGTKGTFSLRAECFQRQLWTLDSLSLGAFLIQWMWNGHFPRQHNEEVEILLSPSFPTTSAVQELPHRYSGQQLLMELWPDPHKEESESMRLAEWWG